MGFHRQAAARVLVILSFLGASALLTRVYAAGDMTAPSLESRASEVAQVPTFVTIPIVGVIGEDVNATGLRAALEEARSIRANCVILLFDSPGGEIAELQRMLEVTSRFRELRLIAYVKSAYSAAAILALSCPEIVMYRDSVIGCAVPFKLSLTGTPVDVDEKFRAAFHAVCRSAARRGKHDSLFATAMVDPESELYVSDTGDLSTDASPRTRVFKPRGKVLALVGDEAVACHLALGVAPSLRELREQLGIPEWRKAGDGPSDAMRRTLASQHREIETERFGEEERLRTDAAAADQRAVLTRRLNDVGEQIRVIQLQLTELQAQRQELVSEGERLRADYDHFVRVIAADRTTAHNDAALRNDPNGIVRATATAGADTRLLDMRFADLQTQLATRASRITAQVELASSAIATLRYEAGQILKKLRNIE